MSNDIKSSGLLVGNGSHAGSRIKDKPAGGSQRPEGEAPLRPDSVSVTDTASRLLQIEDQLSTMPVVNDQRVAEIKQAIAEGSYKIDPERIAEKLIRFESSQTGNKSKPS